MQDIASFKAQVRAILLALGRRATEAEFRKMYHELEVSVKIFLTLFFIKKVLSLRDIQLIMF